MLLKIPRASLVLRMVVSWDGEDSASLVKVSSFQRFSDVVTKSSSFGSIIAKEVVGVAIVVVAIAVACSFSSRPPLVGISLSVFALSPLTRQNDKPHY